MDLFVSGLALKYLRGLSRSTKASVDIALRKGSPSPKYLYLGLKVLNTHPVCVIAYETLIQSWEVDFFLPGESRFQKFNSFKNIKKIQNISHIIWISSTKWILPERMVKWRKIAWKRFYCILNSQFFFSIQTTMRNGNFEQWRVSKFKFQI